MAKTTETGFKRHFPRMKRCCCCFSLKAGVTFFTILLLAFSIISLISDIYMEISGSVELNNVILPKNYNIIRYVISIIYIISLILLLIGIIKNKISFMKLFKYLFGLYIVCDVINSFIICYYMYHDSKGKAEYKKMLEKEINNKYKDDESPEDITQITVTRNINIDRSMEYGEISHLGGVIVATALIVYYYIAACSYSEDIEENLYEEKNARNLENNEY